MINLLKIFYVSFILSLQAHFTKTLIND